MKIIKITCFEVVVPAKKGTVDSPDMNKPLHKLPVGAMPGWSAQFDQLPKLIVNIELDNGIEGWGELYRNHDWAQVEAIANILLGQDISSFPLQQLPITYCREYDGFECAVCDAFAKSKNMPLVDLIGGAVRTKVKVGAWSSHRHLDEIGPLAKKYHEQGFDCIKFKCDLDDNVAGWCREIDEYAPGMQVILDPNERWEQSAEVRKRIDALAEIGNILCLEDPLPRWQLNEFKSLRTYGPIPIALHVSLPYILHGQRVEDAIKAILTEAVDGFNFNCGLYKFKQLSDIASAANLPCWHGSEVDLGILEAMYVHSAAAAETCIWPSDIFGRLIRSHDLLKEPLQINPPYVSLPEGPGLGVEPDRDAIKKYQQSSKTFSI